MLRVIFDRPQLDLGRVGALSRSWLGSTYATCGGTGHVHQKLGELHTIAAQRYVDPATIAAIHASLGEIDEAVHSGPFGIPAHQPNRSGSAPGPSSVAVCRPRPSDPAILRWRAPWYHAGSVA